MDALDLWRDRGTERSLLNDMWDLMSEFDQPLRGTPRRLLRTGQGAFAPACDVSETEDHYILNFDMPGIQKEDIDIEVTGNQLTVSGERKKEEEVRSGATHRVERSFGHFRRTFTVPEGIDSDVIQANYENGVLRVAIPKAEEKKAKKISINSGGKSFLKKLTNKAEAKAVNS